MLAENWNVVVMDGYQAGVSTTHHVTALRIPWLRKKSTISDRTFNITCPRRPSRVAEKMVCDKETRLREGSQNFAHFFSSEGYLLVIPINMCDYGGKMTFDFDELFSPTPYRSTPNPKSSRNHLQRRVSTSAIEILG